MYALFKGNEFVAFTKETPFTGTPTLKAIIQDGKTLDYDRVEDRWDWHDKPFSHIEKLAELATKFFGTPYVATYSSGTSPKHDLARVPKVGDKVSYSFNGDTYPCGTITKVSPTLQVTTSSGKKFRRYKQTGGWCMEGGTWWLVIGHIDERNPHF